MNLAPRKRSGPSSTPRSRRPSRRMPPRTSTPWQRYPNTVRWPTCRKNRMLVTVAPNYTSRHAIASCGSTLNMSAKMMAMGIGDTVTSTSPMTSVGRGIVRWTTMDELLHHRQHGTDRQCNQEKKPGRHDESEGQGPALERGPDHRSSRAGNPPNRVEGVLELAERAHRDRHQRREAHRVVTVPWVEWLAL